MSDKMQVIFVQHTGHVLAAFTRTADPEGKPPVAELVGDGFPARNHAPVPAPTDGVELLIVPPTKLNEAEEVVDAIGVATVDFNEAVFISPMNFAVKGQLADPLSKTTITLKLEADDELTVEVPNDSPTDLNVWAQLAKAPTADDTEVDTRVIEQKLEKNNKSVKLKLTTEPQGPTKAIKPDKPYYIMVLVKGMQPKFATMTFTPSS